MDSIRLISLFAPTKPQQQVDSIFYLRRPDDLVAFLHQYDYRQTINAINAQLLALQIEITEKVQQSTFLYVLD